MVERRDAHRNLSCEIADAQGLTVVRADLLDSLRDLMSVIARNGNLPKEVPLLAKRQAVHQLSNSERSEDLVVVGRIHETQQPHDDIEQILVELAHRDGARSLLRRTRGCTA